ncbi:hypothetical protein D9758_004418 [Tetrapyrgos nigripes]|uniref:N-acetyltransferase domain-containing protein n=1 Tax=Tetrapyrgos nigripes TaxID=182062 RepID=A0A8H5LSR3_9AGAR|nr:hypothetical protein D9758_004418 [Tetrapyrgos nigripes]
MTELVVQRITKMTDAEVDYLAALMKEEYTGQFAVLILVGGDWSLAEEFWTALTRAVLLEGHLYAIKNEEGKIVSAGHWFPPGQGLFKTDVQRALGFNAFFKKLSPEFQEWYTKTYPETVAREAPRFWRKEELNNRWWCNSLVTDHRYQNRGYATAILKTVFRKAVEGGNIIGLGTDTELNVKKYEAMGLRCRGYYILPTPTSKDLTSYVLSREP